MDIETYLRQISGKHNKSNKQNKVNDKVTEESVEEECNPQTNTCLGKVTTDLCTIKSAFMILENIFSKYIIELTNLYTVINSSNETHISNNNKNTYSIIIQKIHDNICKVIQSHIIGDERAIPNESYCIEVDMLCEDQSDKTINIPCFTLLYFLQKTNECDDLLYYSSNPNNIPYTQAIKKTTTHKNAYPVWYYQKKTLITSNYSKISNVKYSDLENRKVIVNSKISECNKKSVKAYGKYKFCYNDNDSGLVLKDPENPTEDISPILQGVDHGIYSYAVVLCGAKASGLITICNTIEVLQQLVKFLQMFVVDINEFVTDLCKSPL